MCALPTKILLASDGSEDAAAAARAATDVSRNAGSELHVVHAWETPNVPAYPRYPLPAEHSSWYERRAEDLLAAQVERIEEAGGSVAGTHLREGPAVDEILDLSEELDVGLIITGSRGLGTLKRLVMGSVSDSIAHHATRPVLVIRGGERAWPPSHIVVGEDLFEEAEGAARLAVELGKVFEAEVRLVLAYPRFPQLSTQRVGAGTDAWTAEEGLRRAEEALEEFSGELERETGLRPQTQAVVGDAAAAILEAADEDGEPALISVGNRDLAQLVRSRLGSVSSDVLRAADGPVLVYKRAAS